MKKKIISLIRKIEKKNGIKVLFAVESGSREWGFASEDSDYDVRCVHLSKKDRYLSLNPPSEQIDCMEGNIDIVSWDIRKFFSLFLKSNPTVSEWLSSNSVYIEKKFWKYSKKDLLGLFNRGFSRNRLQNHYISLAKKNYSKYICNASGEASLKKYVYILRALGCVDYIEKTKSLPPLNWKFSSIYSPAEIRDKFREIVDMKKHSEKAKGARIAELDKWIEKKLLTYIEKDNERFSRKLVDSIIINTINQYSK
jgi:hypothetical protein